MKKGYVISEGYMGYLSDGKYHLFATESDYDEAYDAENEKEEEDND